jgi:hypothetical protein
MFASPEPSSFASYLNAQAASFDAIAQACMAYVAGRAGDLASDEMYGELIRNAQDAGGVDQMLYQLEGDRHYAEHSALLVLSAAWNDPTEVETIKQTISGAAAFEAVDLHDLGIAVLYGMYLLARGGAPALREVTYRQADGQIVTTAMDTPISSATLFEAMRDQYAVP